MQSDYDFGTDDYDQYIQGLRLYDKARVNLLRRAVVDHRLKSRARLVLFAVAQRCHPFTCGACIPTRDLETATDLPVLSIARAVADLRTHGYIMTGPGKMYWILPIRVVAEKGE